MYSVLPGNSIPATLITDGMFTVQCTSVENTQYAHNLGIVAVIVGPKPDNDTFDICHSNGTVLGTYTVIANPTAGRKYRLWTATGERTAKSRRNRKSVQAITAPAVTTAPSAPKPLLVAASAPNYSGRTV